MVFSREHGMGPLGEYASLLRSLQEISVGAGQISINMKKHHTLGNSMNRRIIRMNYVELYWK